MKREIVIDFPSCNTIFQRLDFRFALFKNFLVPAFLTKDPNVQLYYITFTKVLFEKTDDFRRYASPLSSH